MKKILLFFIIWWSLLSTNIVFAESNSSCPIRWNSAKVLNDYIKNVRQLVTNINNQLWESQPSDSKLDKTLADMSRMFYQAVNWDGYFLDFDYYVITPIFDSIPSFVHRDLAILDSETDGLRKYLTNLAKSWYADISLDGEKICKWVKNCDFSNASAANILWKVINNNINISNTFKEIVTSEKEKYSTDAIILPINKTDFINELVKNYWQNAIAQCDNEEDQFWKKIKELRDKILLNNKQWADGIKKWQEAWKLLVWAVNWETDRDLERNILAKELQRQWLSTNQKKILLDNLDEFNDNNFYSLENNFVTNSFESIVDAWREIKDWFKEATKWLFSEENTEEINKNASVWLWTFQTQTENNLTTESIKSRLDILYNKQKNFTAIEDYQANSIISEIIQIHQSLNNTAFKCELAVTVCESQWAWKWNCWTCK